MPRGKIPISLIGNPRTRAATFAKRKEGLRKKARELATLCDVPVLLVCASGPDGGGGAAEVWASEEGILDRYRALPPETRAGHKHRRYLEDELGKERAKLASRRQDGPGALAPWDAALNEMTLGEARELLETVDAALRATSERRRALGLPADRGDGRLEQTAPDASNAVVQSGHGVQYIGSNSVNVDGHQLQMMPGDGSSYQYAPLAWDDGFQPRNAGMMQRGYGSQCTGSSYVVMDDHQMQAPSNGNVRDGWLNLAMWRTDEPCNAAVPIGYPASLDVGGNFIDDTPAEHPALGTGSDFANTPVSFLATPTGIGGNFMNVQHRYETRSSAEEFERSDTSLGQLHYLGDLAEGMRFGSGDTQLQPWGNY